MPDFDLVVIGAGAAGLSVAAGAAQLGASVALIERGVDGRRLPEHRLRPKQGAAGGVACGRSVRDAARFGVIADAAGDRLGSACGRMSTA